MNLHWRRRRPGESFEAWSERVEVRVTKRDPVTGEGYYPGYGWQEPEGGDG